MASAAILAGGRASRFGGRDKSTLVVGGATILELKYPGPAPALFKRLVERFALVPKTASKYRMGLSTAMPAPIGLTALLNAPVGRSAKREGGPTEFHA